MLISIPSHACLHTVQPWIAIPPLGLPRLLLLRPLANASTEVGSVSIAFVASMSSILDELRSRSPGTRSTSPEQFQQRMNAAGHTVVPGTLNGAIVTGVTIVPGTLSRAFVWPEAALPALPGGTMTNQPTNQTTSNGNDPTTNKTNRSILQRQVDHRPRRREPRHLRLQVAPQAPPGPRRLRLQMAPQPRIVAAFPRCQALHRPPCCRRRSTRRTRG